MDQYLATVINTDQVLTYKNFEQKYTSYVDATKVRLESKEKSSIRNKMKIMEKESSKNESKESDSNIKKMIITMMQKMIKIMDTMIAVQEVVVSLYIAEDSEAKKTRLKECAEKITKTIV